MGSRWIVISIVVLGLISACIGLSFFGGYIVGYYESGPFKFVQRVENKLFGGFFSSTKRDEEPYFDSIFLRLKYEKGIVPVQRSGAGGGMTSFGDAILLLTHEGKIFSARSAHDIKETKIETPDNGFATYVRVAQSDRYKGLVHNFSWFRYNDILHYRLNYEHGLIISYTKFNEEQECYVTAVSVLVLKPEIENVEQIYAYKDDWKILYQTQPCLPLKREWRAIEGHMAGGRIAFGPPATIYLASGDYAWDGIYAPEALSQKLDNDYGKVIGIDLISRNSRILSVGNRNMQGIAVDRNRELWVAEHGMRGGDELNRIIEGKNYGWPEESLGTRYNRLPISNTKSYGRHENFTPPAFAWLPSVAPSNLIEIEGFHESWDGDLLMASLKARSLFRIRVRDNHVEFVESIQIGKRIRYVHQHGDGSLVLWTDDKHLIFLNVAEQNFEMEFIRNYIAEANYNKDQRNKVEVAVGLCMECHSFEPGGHSDAPSLTNIFDAPVGASSYDKYSEALRNHGGRWSRDELSAFLQNPEAYVPGTAMPDPGIDNSFVLGELINILEAASKTAE